MKSVSELYYLARYFVEKHVANMDKALDFPLLRRKFRRKLGYDLDLKNPQTLNDKIQWRKIYDHNPIYIEGADKYGVRKTVARMLADTDVNDLFADVYCITEDVEAIDFASLPASYILKPTHGSGWLKIIREGDTPNIGKLRRSCRNWLARTYGYRNFEWAYTGITPRILVEELLTYSDGRLAGDMKFYIFGGKVEAIFRVENRFDNLEGGVFNSNWEPATADVPLSLADKPFGCDRMLEIAEQVGSHFDYIRVDFLSTDRRFVLNELTFYPQSGYEDCTYYGSDPYQCDIAYGQKWKQNRPVVPQGI